MMVAPGVVVGGDFRVEARLGEGGMGEVWIAEQLSVGRKRALKVMRRELVDDARLRERFVLEARIGATIESDHVVEVVAAGVDEELRVPWIAMELLDGESLEAAIARRGPLPWSDVATIAAQLGHALAAAHAAGVVHRDLKPENVFLARPRRIGGGAFEVKVLDFGIAKLVEGAGATSGQSLLVGTPLYMAPEQTEPTIASSPATDVWALGLIAYRALTGRSFWRGNGDGALTITGLLRQVLFDPIPPASVRAAEDGAASLLPEGFDAWMLRCVARAPDARFAEAGAACEALARLLEGAAPPEPAKPPRSIPPLDLELAETSVSLRPAVARAARPIEVDVVHRGDAFSFGRIDDVLIVRWWRVITVDALRAMGRVTGGVLAKHAGQFVVLPVIDKSLRRPEPGAADALDEVMQVHEARIDNVANVVLGSGFQAAIVRALITGMTMARRPRHPVKVFATIAEGIASFGPRPNLDAVVAAVERFASVEPVDPVS